MPITVRWDDPQQNIVRYDFIGMWTWSDYELAVQEAFRLMSSVDHPVYAIADFSASGPMPAGGFNNVRNAITRAPSNFQSIALVGTSLFIKSVVRVFAQVYRDLGQRMIVVDSEDDARAAFQASASD